ncbi:molybdenum cofactor guanylyltransferase MobA [Microvirga sp. CF3016]|uniref:molybdenum cofactor guanylyltransferase MobA n=1 Tax=Microvirga sp. CF3016 TaxID=3110181 RepID=UPI002E7636F2|nr:molybdenum cofactor guanylyltransferase MobA [Microvirga sp. CF3016]MEE1611644.1 molybdenum cofactor guanylyltransferase MobA [Microvirga sp. CF3016]
MTEPLTLGVILAGGLSRRMGGGNKVLLTVEGLTLLAHVAQRLVPQCEGVILNANGELPRSETMHFPVVPDAIAGHLGPLAGILTALEWSAAHHPHIEWVVSVPGDTPFIPLDLVRHLHEARQASGRALACASSGSQVHFAVGLWPVSLRYDLRRMLLDETMRSVGDCAERHGFAKATWPIEPVDPFFNINTPDDWAQATILAKRETVR